MGEWISTDKRLPNCDELVLTFSLNDGICIGFLHRDGRFKVYSSYPSTPTHWMPLPEPPEVE